MVPKLARAAAVFALGSLFSAFSSCSAALVSGFAWRDGEGKALEFRQASDFPQGEEGKFGHARLRNRYVLLSPLAVGPGQDLELGLEFRGGSPARLALSLSSKPGGEEAFFSTTFSLKEAGTSYVLPLEAGREISSLSIELLPAEEGGAPPEFELAKIALVRAFRGFEKKANQFRISPGLSLYRQGDKIRARLEEPFAFTAGSWPAGESMGYLPALVLSYGPSRASGEHTLLELEASPGSPLRFRPRLGGGSLRIPLLAFDAPPQRLELELPAETELRALYAASMPADEALVLDLGAVLRARSADPAADFDLYRWDLLPEVLVFDFRDYAAQDLYLKRLAFFVEKEGFRGRLASDKEIASLHGWNAHDYRPEDLAAFFEAARNSGFPLNAEETRLEAILLDQGVIRKETGALRPGRGALISISRESAPYLRSTFITHEASHALYFADADFRGFVQAEWAKVTAGERWFWRLYFDWMKYDISNEYLMASEFMAYLYQQPVSKVEEYFTQLLPSRLLQNHPDLAPQIEVYMAEYGARFAERAGRIENWLIAKYELRAGQAYSLY